MSDPVRVLSVGYDVLAVEKNGWMRPGVSGAAVVALRDMALVGLYDGPSLRKALVAAFTPSMYTDVCTLSDVGSESYVVSPGQARSVYSGLRNRGLGKVADTAMAAVVPLYSGTVHVGMGFLSGDTLYTLCDPDVAPLAREASGQPLVFSRGPGPYFHAYAPGSGGALPAVVRKPAYGEGVFVIGKDADGDYYSNSKARVIHIGADAQFFQVSPLELEGALPLSGGLVVALADAAVVGCFAGVKHTISRGEVGLCQAFPELKPMSPASERPEVGLMKVFPFLRPGAWSPGVAKAALTHASCGVEPGAPTMAALAMVGDSAIRTALWVRLMEQSVPTAKWQSVLQKDHRNSTLAATCEQLGLAAILRLGHGAHVPSGSKVHADLLEAVAGAVYLNESVEVFETFCLTIGVLKEDYSDSID